MNQKYSKQEILLKGIYLLRRQGYHNTGIKEILNECGIPKGSFYNFFKSKEDFGIQCLVLYGQSMLRLIQQHTQDEELDPLERLQAYFELSIATNEEEDMQFGCLVMNSATELAGYNDAFAEINRQIFSVWLTELADCIQQGQDLGEIREDYQAIELAEYLYTSIFGAYANGKMKRSTQPLKLMLDAGMAFVSQ